MATADTISIRLPEAVLSQARALASSDGRPLDEVVAIAIDRYAQSRSTLEEMLREGQQYGRQIGITCDEEVERVANGTLSLDQLRPSA
jgi:hypothetical protein